MKKISDLFLCPARLFMDIKSDDRFPVKALMITLFLLVVYSLLYIPVEEANPDIFNPEALTEGEHYFPQFGIGFIILIGIIFIPFFLFYAYLLFWLLKIIDIIIPYKKVLELFVWTEIISLLGDYLNLGIVYYQGITTLNSKYDMYPIGFHHFANLSHTGTYLYELLASLNPFEIWSVTLLIWGLKIMSGVDKSKVTWIACLFWGGVVMINAYLVM